MGTTRFALIVIGTRNDAWGKLSRSKQSEFIARVEQATRTAGVIPVNGYRLSATPGAFIEIWEGASRAGIDRAIKGLQAMGYTRYVDARFMIGERAILDEGASQEAEPQDAENKT